MAKCVPSSVALVRVVKVCIVLVVFELICIVDNWHTCCQ